MLDLTGQLCPRRVAEYNQTSWTYAGGFVKSQPDGLADDAWQRCITQTVARDNLSARLHLAASRAGVATLSAVFRRGKRLCRIGAATDCKWPQFIVVRLSPYWAPRGPSGPA